MFDWKKFYRQVAAIAIPVAFQNLLTSTASMVDTIMIAPLGETTVAAVGLCVQFSMLMFSGYWGFIGGGMLFFSQYWGAKDYDGINRSYGMMLTCVMSVGILFGCGALLFPGTIMRLYTDKTAIQEIGIQYLRIIGFAYPLQVYAVSMGALLRTTEKVQLPFYASLCSVASNIFLNWVFIYGNLGAPAMGVKGAALASVCASVINVSFSLIECKVVKYPFVFNVKKHFKWVKEKTAEFFRKCFPISCNEVAMGIANLIISMVMGRQVESAIAAIAVLRTIEGFVIAFFTGFSNASSVLVGVEVGAGRLENAYERAKRLIPLVSSCIAIAGIGINIFKPVFLPVMGLAGDSYSTCSKFILIYTIVAVIRMCNWTMNDTYRASGDATTGTVLEIVFMFILVLPVMCLLGLKFKVPVVLVFASCYIDEPIRFTLMQIHMYSGRWVRPVTENGKRNLENFRASKHRSFYNC